MAFEFVTTVGIIVLIIEVVTLLKSVTKVRQYEKGILERFGKYKEILDPGL